MQEQYERDEEKGGRKKKHVIHMGAVSGRSLSSLFFYKPRCNAMLEYKNPKTPWLAVHWVD